MLSKQEIDVSQTKVLEKIQTYLSKRNGENVRDSALIEKFKNSRGYCSGISTLWSYAKWSTWVQTQHKNQKSKEQSNSKLSTRCDYAWFKSTVELIADHFYGGLSEDLIEKVHIKKEIDDVECFISLIEYFQNIDDYLPKGQGNLNRSLEDTIKINAKDYRSPKKEHSIASLFTLEQLKYLLKNEDIIKDGKLILISSHNHDTALFKDGIYYYYFDPNNKVGEVQKISTDDIATLIFNANEFDIDTPSPLGFRIFSFDEISSKYTEVQDVLDKITPPLILYPKKDYAREFSGLAIAVSIGSLESVEYFLKRGIDPNKTLIIPDKYVWFMLTLHGVDVKKAQCTMLMLAVERGHPDIVQTLLEHKVDHSVENGVGLTALSLAVKTGSVDIIKLLIKHNVNLDEVTGSDKRTALMRAAMNNSVTVIELLREYNVDPNKADSNGYNALMLAVEKGNFEATEALLKIPNINCDKALILAIDNKHIKIIEELLKAKANPNVVYEDRTALTAAVINNIYSGNQATNIVELLFKYDADPNIKNDNGDTVLMFAIGKGQTHKFDDQDIVKNIKMLLEKEANPNIQNKQGKTALMLAIEKKYVGVVKELLETKKVDLTPVDIPAIDNFYIKFLIKQEKKRIFDEQEKMEIESKCFENPGSSFKKI